MLGVFLLAIAIAAVFHAAFSTYEYLSHLKALGLPEGTLPSSIVVETLLGMMLGILGASLNAPKLKEITWASEMRKRNLDEMDSRLGFANYVTRARNLFAATSTR